MSDSIRELVKSTTDEQIAKDHNKTQLIEMAQTAGVEEPKGTKMELVAAIRGQFPLPDPALRGKSEVDGPVAAVWAHAEIRFISAADAGEPKPRRKDIVDECVQDGIAYYTARTQYQAWYKATDGGDIRLADLSGLPKSVDAFVNPEEAVAA